VETVYWMPLRPMMILLTMQTIRFPNLFGCNT
jgi:hypothetical protein